MKVSENRTIDWVRYGVLFMSVIFIIAGIIKQEHLEVLQKAVKICLECIGIG